MTDTDSSSSDGHVSRLAASKKLTKAPKVAPRSYKHSKDENSMTKQQTDNLELVLNKINRSCGKKLKTVQDVISFITNLYEGNETEELKNEIEENRKKYTKEIKYLKKELEEEKEKYEELAEESKGHRKLKNDFKKSESKITELEEEISNKIEEIKEKEKEIKTKNQKIDAMKVENNELQNNYKRLQDQYKELHSQVNEMQKEKSCLEKGRDIMRNEKEESLRKLKNETQNLNDIITAKDKAIQAIKDKLNETGKEKYELNNKIARMSAEMEECKRDLMYEKQNNNKLSNEFENRKLYYENKIKNLEQEIQQIRVNKFRNPNENAPNNKRSEFDNKQNDDLPEWWDNHREKRNNRRPQLVQCQNCREDIPITEIEHHGKICFERFDED